MYLRIFKDWVLFQKFNIINKKYSEIWINFSFSWLKYIHSKYFYPISAS